MRNVLFTECRDFNTTHSLLFTDQQEEEESEVFDLMEVATIAHDVYCNDADCDIDEDGDARGWDGEHHQKWLKIALRLIQSNISIRDLIEAHDAVVSLAGNKK